jgi:uncharacterized oxidoreductase
MDLNRRTVVVTGGASGIGLAIAERFQRAGSTVIICGRRDDRLREAQAARPDLVTHIADVTAASDRVALRDWVVRQHPSVDVLVNNAGIQRRVSLMDDEPWEATHEEIAINLEAPMHLSRLFIPHLRQHSRAAIVNVTSGLSFAPLANVPIYCATKAALHSFTLSLRHQLRDTSIEVVEIVPPAVNTDLGGPGLHTFGVDVNEFADAVMSRVANGEREVGYGFAEQSRQGSRDQLDAMFERMNAPRS